MNNQNISENLITTDHVYTYIHTYMEKRKRKENTKNTNVIFYDGKDLEELKELAFRNNTDVSSIVSNLIREFLLLFKSESPQKTLFNFEDKPEIIDFENIENRELKFLLLNKSEEDFSKWEERLAEISRITSKVYTLRQN